MGVVLRSHFKAVLGKSQKEMFRGRVFPVLVLNQSFETAAALSFTSSFSHKELFTHLTPNKQNKTQCKSGVCVFRGFVCICILFYLS